MYLLNFNNIF